MTMKPPRSATTIANTIPSYPTSSHYLMSQLRTCRDKLLSLPKRILAKRKKVAGKVGST
jgi:hypothetical protein